VQSYGDQALDASALRFPLVEFIDGDDPRMTSTIDRIMQQLETSEGLVHRYDVVSVARVGLAQESRRGGQDAEADHDAEAEERHLRAQI
jgi:GH15 family glucan-1,4-alpha-glucosidase